MANKEAPRGIRNNNPGNIRHTKTDWKGLANPPSDGAFCVFIAPQYGIRALSVLLRNYSRYYGIRTIKNIIARFAPATENQTDAYIRSVCKATGFDDSEQLDLEQDAVVIALMKAIIKHENGQQPYTDEQLQAGLQC